MKLWKAVCLWLASDIPRVRELQKANLDLRQQLAKQDMDIEILEAWVSLLKKDANSEPELYPEPILRDYVTRVIPNAKRLVLNDGIALFDQPRGMLLAIIMNEIMARHHRNAAEVPLYQLALTSGDTFTFNKLRMEFK
jgi:hypothetical protein